jgi:hypothetical protein
MYGYFQEYPTSAPRALLAMRKQKQLDFGILFLIALVLILMFGIGRIAYYGGVAP